MAVKATSWWTASILAEKPVVHWPGPRIPVYLILNLLAHGYDFNGSSRRILC